MYMIIVGAGSIGTSLIDIAVREKNNVVLIDADADRAREISNKYDITVLSGNATSADTVREAGAERADALIVTGRATGEKPVVGELKSVKQAVGDVPVLVGSGVNPENARELLALADGAIVGTSLKKDGQTENEVDVSRVSDLLKHLGR